MEFSFLVANFVTYISVPEIEKVLPLDIIKLSGLAHSISPRRRLWRRHFTASIDVFIRKWKKVMSCREDEQSQTLSYTKYSLIHLTYCI